MTLTKSNQTWGDLLFTYKLFLKTTHSEQIITKLILNIKNVGSRITKQ